jgi:response regulator of citrate/malate metabolism
LLNSKLIKALLFGNAKVLQALHQGAADYMIKPINKEILGQKINRLFSKPVIIA